MTPEEIQAENAILKQRLHEFEDRSNSKVLLDIGPLEILICSKMNQLPQCPFCGNDHPVLASYQNPTSGYFGCQITCGDFKCNAIVYSTEKTRTEAQRTVIKKWSRRVPALIDMTSPAVYKILDESEFNDTTRSTDS